MDVASALASVASRKQLRRLGGALELAVDEGGRLDEVLSLDATTVDAAMLSVLGAEGAMRARSRLEELRAAPEEPPVPPPDPARAVRSPSSARPKTVSEGCCVECSQPSPYVFPPLAVRLCESCERLPRYALVTADLARHACVGDDEFRSVRRRAEIGSTSGQNASRRVRRRGTEAPRRLKTAGALGRSAEYGTLEGANTAMFQKRAMARTSVCRAPDVAADCMDLSCLVRCDVAAL